MHNRVLGARGEDAAERYLRSLGYEIIGRNCRTPYGELDIIARDGTVTVFIEVKTRATDKYGSGFDAIDSKKQRTLIKCASYYARAKGIAGELRIDAIEIVAGRLTHLKGALE